MQINHGSADFCVTKKTFQGDDVHPLFQQMGSITVAQAMQADIFGDRSFFECFAHHPAQTFNAIAAIGFFAIEKKDKRFFETDVFFQTYGHAISQRDNPVLLVFALTDVDGFALEVDVGDFQVNDLLGAQTGRIDQRQHNPVFEQLRSSEQRFKFAAVEDDRQAGVFFERRQVDGPFCLTDVTEVEPQSIDHVFEAAARGRVFVQCQSGEIVAEFFVRNQVGQPLKMDTDQGNTADVIAKGALALTFENHLLLHGVVELVKAFNSQHGLLNLCGSISFFS